MLALGIDPGLAGGLALIEAGAGSSQLLRVVDVPTTGEGAKRRVDVAGVLAFLQGRPIDHAFIERAQAMPQKADENGVRRGQGASSAFNYGRAVGALEACVVGMQIPLTVVEAAVWKRDLGLIGRGKEDSRQRAIQLFPGARGLERKKDHNRGEACLIAWHGLRKLRLAELRAAE